MTYKLLKRIIESGSYDKEDISNKIDVFLTFNRVTKEEYEELQNLMGEVTHA